jgi:hypothetical protein
MQQMVVNNVILTKCGIMLKSCPLSRGKDWHRKCIEYIIDLLYEKYIGGR